MCSIISATYQPGCVNRKCDPGFQGYPQGNQKGPLPKGGLGGSFGRWTSGGGCRMTLRIPSPPGRGGRRPGWVLAPQTAISGESPGFDLARPIPGAANAKSAAVNNRLAKRACSKVSVTPTQRCVSCAKRTVSACGRKATAALTQRGGS